MEEIYISSEELSEMEQLGRGACSTVYKYRDLALKVLNDSGVLMHNEGEFSNMLGIENGTCVFPKSRLFLDGKFRGYSMECIQGRPAQDIIMELDLRKLMDAIKFVEEDLKDVSNKKIFLLDFNQGGLMWDEKNSRLKIIDTDFFERNDEMSEEQCYNENLEVFNTLIELLLQIQMGQPNKVAQYLLSNEEYSDSYHEYINNAMAGNKPSVIGLIEKAIEIFETDFGVHIDTMKDIGLLVGERFEHKEVDLDNIPIFEPPAEDSILQIGVEATGDIRLGEINGVISTIKANEPNNKKKQEQEIIK